MKNKILRLLFISILAAFQISSFAQNVGIGTTTPTNKLSVEGSANFTGNVGIGTNTPISKLTLNGFPSDYVQGPHWAALAGDALPVFQQLNWSHDNIGLQFDSYYSGTNWLSSSNTNNFQIYKLGGKLQFNYATNINAGDPITWLTGLTLDGSGKVGISTATPTNKLSVSGNADFTGNVGIGTSTPLAKLHLAGNVKIDGINTLEFGAGVVGKEASAGKIGYQTFTPGALDIVGAGTLFSNRKIKFFNEGGAEFTGNVGIGTATPSNKLSVSGNADFTGNVGIGTASPSAKLHISGNDLNNQIRMDDGSAAVTRLNANYALNGPYPYIGTTSNHPFGIIANNAYRIFVNNTGNVGIGTTTPNASAALEVSSTTKGFMPPKMSRSQRDLISPVTGLIVYNTTTKKPNYYDGLAWQNFDGSYVIGDNYQGGIIAYILQPGDPGYIAGQTHGLIAAAADQSTAAEWGCYGTPITGADGTALGTGNLNTIEIMTGCGEAGIAARICGDLVLNGYSDWYLPSLDELNKLYINQAAVGGFANLQYWSSTEWSNNFAWRQQFGSGFQSHNSKAFIQPVRAIRSF